MVWKFAGLFILFTGWFFGGEVFLEKSEERGEEAVVQLVNERFPPPKFAMIPEVFDRYQEDGWIINVL